MNDKMKAKQAIKLLEFVGNETPSTREAIDIILNQLKQLKHNNTKMNAKLRKALRVFKEIREIQHDCKDCSWDCMWCYNGTRTVFNLADRVIKKLED